MFESIVQWHYCATGGKKMRVSSLPSAHRSATARCDGGRNKDKPTTTTTTTAIKQIFQPFTWNATLIICAAIVLLNTVGLISNASASADTVQYPVTAAVIPPGKISIPSK